MESTLASAGFLKATISDKKRSLASQSHVMKPCDAKVGLACLGNQYLYAHDYYTSLGDYYFRMATERGFAGILPTVMKCYKIAATNIHEVIKLANSESTNYTDYRGKFAKACDFAEQVKAKIASDPLKYDVQRQYLHKFTEHE